MPARTLSGALGFERRRGPACSSASPRRFACFVSWRRQYLPYSLRSSDQASSKGSILLTSILNCGTVGENYRRGGRLLDFAFDELNFTTIRVSVMSYAK